MRAATAILACLLFVGCGPSEEERNRQQGVLAELVRDVELAGQDIEYERKSECACCFMRTIAIRRAIDERIRNLEERIQEVRERREITLPSLLKALDTEVVARLDRWNRERADLPRPPD